jgi:hypothetical protein
MRSKWDRMSTGKNATGKGEAVSKVATGKEQQGSFTNITLGGRIILMMHRVAMVLEIRSSGRFPISLEAMRTTQLRRELLLR